MANHKNLTSPDNSTKVSKLIPPQKLTDNFELNSIKSHPDINHVAEYIDNKFYFAILTEGKNLPKSIADVHFFSIDDELIYQNFFNDFGPLNLSCLYKYCWKVSKKLNNPRYCDKQIVHYCIKSNEKKANAAFLISSFAVLCLNKSPKDAYKPLLDANISLKPFQDASIGHSIYHIRLQDCLNALFKSVAFGFLNLNDFDVSEYEKYEKVEYGDMNWIVPQKFLAFSGPSTEPGTLYHAPERYHEYFKENNISTVIRLNKESYDSSRFTRIGINHYDIYLPDGSIPSRKVLYQFLYISEVTNGPIAVHCKAGLGRTGSLICAYLIKHYKMTAKEAIAWTRICRPGSVIGHQQTWLESMQKELLFSGQQYRMKHFSEVDKIFHHKYGMYSIVQKIERKNNSVKLPKNLTFRQYFKLDSVEKNKSDDLSWKRKLSNNDISTKNKQLKFINFFGTNGSICDYIVRKFGGLSERESTSSEKQTDKSSNSKLGKRNSTDELTVVNHQMNKSSDVLTQGDLLKKIKI
ncbi:dual specificity protein phosphatase CDC14C-like, partial [Cotesia glomerata]